MDYVFQLYTNGEHLIEAMPITYGDFACGRDATANAEQLAREGYVTRGRVVRNGIVCFTDGEWVASEKFLESYSPTGLIATAAP